MQNRWFLGRFLNVIYKRNNPHGSYTLVLHFTVFQVPPTHLPRLISPPHADEDRAWRDCLTTGSSLHLFFFAKGVYRTVLVRQKKKSKNLKLLNFYFNCITTATLQIEVSFKHTHIYAYPKAATGFGGNEVAGNS